MLCRASKKKFDEDAGFKTRARETVTRLQGGDEASLAAWRRICAASRLEFEKIYERLGVTIQERGESFYNPRLPGVVEELGKAGILEESDGAKVVWTDEDREKVPPLMVQKSDGGFGYARCGCLSLCFAFVMSMHSICAGEPEVRLVHQRLVDKGGPRASATGDGAEERRRLRSSKVLLSVPLAPDMSMHNV